MTRHWKHSLCAVLPVAGLLCTAPVVMAYDDESGRYDRHDQYGDEEPYDRQERDRRAQGSPWARMSEPDRHSFERYLDTHDETAQILYQNPDLITYRRFVRQHEALNDWLANYT